MINAPGLCSLLLVAAAALPAPATSAVRLRTRTIEPAASPGALVPGRAASLVVASKGAVTAGWKRELEAAGAKLVTYLPDRAFLVRVDGSRAAALAALPGTAFVAPWLAGDKLAPELGAAMDARLGQRLPVHVLVAPDVPAATVAASLAALGLEIAGSGDGGPFNDVVAYLPSGRLDLAEAAAASEDIIWIEPRLRRALLNDASIWVCQSGLDGGQKSPVFEHGVYGAGEIVAVLDTGLDWDMCYFQDPAGPPPLNPPGGLAVDLSQRKVVAYDFLLASDDPSNPRACDNQGHGTHVSGTVAGDNLANPLVHDRGDGHAPGAKLVAQDGGYGPDDCADLPALGCPVVDLTPLFDQAYRQGARFHSNSWGDQENFMPQNNYTAACVDTDDFMWTHPDFLILYAAGNSGPGDATVGSPSVAKSTLSVGGTNHGANADTLAGFSSRGFAADGRIKPTVTAPAVSVSSASNDFDTGTGNCGTVQFQGTSMACPAAAGLSALVAEYYAAGYYPGRVRKPADGFRPSAALIKATVMNGARSMKGEAPIPSRGQGWGRITLGDVLAFPGTPRDLQVVDDKVGFPTGATEIRYESVEVKGSGLPLKVTLVWTDAPSSPMAATNLVNDLDLEVSGPSGTFLGNVFASGSSVPGGTADRINVEEQVLIPAPQPGIYTIAVKPAAIPIGPQPYALVLTGDLPTPLDLAYQSLAIVAEENGNGWPDPGERLQVAITLLDRSDAPATAIAGTLASLTPALTVSDFAGTWPDLAPGEARPSLPDHFELVVSAAAACGARLPLELSASSGGSTFVSRFELVIGGYGSVFSERLDAIAEGTTPAGWVVTSNRPAFGKAVADSSVEPVASSPGPTSTPHALFLGTRGNDLDYTRIDAMKRLDLGAFAGRPVTIGFDWWVHAAEAQDGLSVGISESGNVWFPWDILRTPANYDSATVGGGQWGRTEVELTTLPGFTAGPDVWVRFVATVTQSEANGDGVYIDGLEVQALGCDPAGCAEVVADLSATTIVDGCPNRPVLLDASRSRATGACSDLAYEWYQGSVLVGTGPSITVFPLEPTRYRLELRCTAPASCRASYSIDVPVVAATRSAVAPATLRAVRNGASAELSWTGIGTGFNVATATAKAELPTLWTRSPLNPSPLGTPSYSDPTPAPPGAALQYQVYGVNSCNGRSAP